ncbi:hypothetical protein GCM10008995_03660 [Halobellus salinus]|uniref:Uncharacterized protein n=1 Tax=Halobellus salinus TaxID=931585 RepID=A0A830E7C3_9EURY|nr:hypothetical protein GCM10008995_03660 [Halobellus salinus]
MEPLSYRGVGTPSVWALRVGAGGHSLTAARRRHPRPQPWGATATPDSDATATPDSDATATPDSDATETALDFRLPTPA